MDKLILAIILAIAVTIGTLAFDRNGTDVVIDTQTRIELARPEPIDWGQVTPKFRLKTERELTARERQEINK